MLVPPMSKLTASAKPHAAAMSAAARTPPAGPESNSDAAARAPSATGTSPPADVITSASRRERLELAEIRRAHRLEERLDDRRHHAFVLAELRAHLVRAHDELRPHGAQRRRDRALVRGIEIGVQQAHRDRVDLGARARAAARRRARSPDRARRVGPTPRSAGRAARAGPAGRRTGRRATDGPGGRSRSRRRSRASRSARPARRAVRAARSSRPSCRARARRHGRGRRLPPIARSTARAGSSGVDATFATRPSSATTSVNVPPLSIPSRTRRRYPRPQQLSELSSLCAISPTTVGGLSGLREHDLARLHEIAARAHGADLEPDRARCAGAAATRARRARCASAHPRATHDRRASRGSRPHRSGRATRPRAPARPATARPTRRDDAASRPRRAAGARHADPTAGRGRAGGHRPPTRARPTSPSPRGNRRATAARRRRRPPQVTAGCAFPEAQPSAERRPASGPPRRSRSRR